MKYISISAIVFFILTLFTAINVSAQDSIDCSIAPHKLYTEGNYTNAYKEFSSCLKTIDDKTSEEYNTILLYMGICALENAEYKPASSLLHTAEKYFTPPSDNYFVCKQHLAALAKRQGNFDESENILLQILEIQENDTLASCAKKAITLNDLGVIYKRLGQYDRSIHFFSQSLQLKQGCLSPEDRSITISLNNLAGVYMKLKAFDKADSLYTESIRIKTEQFGPNHPSTLLARNNLAELYRQQGNYSQSLAILQDVAQRKLATIGENSFSYATTLHTIANVYFSSANYKDAITYCLNALSIKEALSGKTSVTSIHSKVLLAKTYHAMHKNRDAQDIYTFILTSKKEEIDAYFNYLGEEEKIQYVKSNTTYWKDFTSFVFDIQSDPNKTIKNKNDLLNQWIEYHWYFSGMILEETQRQHRLWESIKDSAQLQLVSELKELKDAIAKIYLLKNTENEKQKNELNQLTTRASAIEQELTTAFRIEKRKQYAVSEITHTLESNECIVEIVKPLNTTGKYLALIYFKDLKTPHTIWLPMAALLEGKGYAKYKNSIQFKMEDTLSRRLFWKPIIDFLSGYASINNIFFVRDGIYEYINIYTLMSKEDNRFNTIVYLNKTENIISHKLNTDEIPIQSALFLYHPHYGSSTECSYEDLPGTKREVDTINTLFHKKQLNTIGYGEEKATETRIKNDSLNYSIMHIATHGYMDINPENDYTESMIHSGLLMSGVCDATQIDSIMDIDDGILTSYEIAQLNLSKTKLVVLSACQSGLGIIDNHEGILGLQRGLFVAGTQRVLVSLWKIDDAVTALWMYHFYEKVLETTSYQDAYLYAQQKIKEGYPSPYYWGAFVLIEQ